MATLRSIPNNYTSDWSIGLGLDWVDTFGNTPVHSAGKLLFNSTNTPSGNACLMPKFVIGAKVPFVVEVPSIFTGALAVAGSGMEAGYRAVTLYNGEFNYCGVYLNRTGAVDIIDFSPLNMVWLKDITAVKPAGWWVSGDEIAVKIEYSPIAGETYFSIKKTAGEYELIYTRTDGVNGRAWAEPSTLWLPNYRMSGAGWSLTYGDITINRTSNKRILAGAYNGYVWGGWQAQLQQIWGDWPTFNENSYQSETEFDLWREGSTEGAQTAGGMMGPYYEDYLDTGNAFAKNGSYSKLSPEITTANGFSAIRLFGSQNVGTTRVRLTDIAGTLISDSEITGNSTGFFPDGGSFIPLEVNLTGVTTNVLRFETTITVDIPTWSHTVFEYNAGASSWDYSTALHGFVVEDLGPLLTAEDATTTPTASSATLTGTLTASSATTTPQAAPATLVGLITATDPVTTPTASVAILDASEPSTGGGSIRSPSGGVIQQFRADGSSITTFRYVSGTWQ